MNEDGSMKRVLIATSVALGCATATALADPVNLQPGEWTYTLTMTIPGTTMGPIVETENDCLGEWESKLEPTELAKEFAGGANCTASNVKQTENNVSFDLSCPGEAMESATMVLTHDYTSFTMDGDVKLAVGEGQTMQSKLTVDAKRVGVCAS